MAKKQIVEFETQNKIRIPYELLTPEQKEEIVNGCGGKGSWLKPPLMVFYKTSCNHHDYGYWCGVTEKERKECDVQLMQNMIVDCVALPWWQFILYYPWCAAYYLMVRKYGKNFFYWGPQKRWPAPTNGQMEELNLI